MKAFAALFLLAVLALLSAACGVETVQLANLARDAGSDPDGEEAAEMMESGGPGSDGGADGGSSGVGTSDTGVIADGPDTDARVAPDGAASGVDVAADSSGPNAVSTDAADAGDPGGPAMTDSAGLDAGGGAGVDGTGPLDTGGPDAGDAGALANADAVASDATGLDAPNEADDAEIDGDAEDESGKGRNDS